MERLREYVGTAVIDEVPLRIQRIHMMGGYFHLTATAFGPVPDHAEGETDVEFIGLDGSTCGSLRLYVQGWHGVTDPSRSVTALLRIRVATLSQGE